MAGRKKYKRERIPIDEARALYDKLGTWRKVAATLQRSTGQRFTEQAIWSAVRWADQGYVGTVYRAAMR